MTTVQAGINDALYFAVFYDTTVKYRQITLPEQNYTLMLFANQLKNHMNSVINTAEAEFDKTWNLGIEKFGSLLKEFLKHKNYFSILSFLF